MRFSSINPDSGVPVYEQIENLIQFSIVVGDYGPGDRLPSVMGLAKDLKVNLNTVAKAYRDLEVNGIIYTRRGAGCYVKKGAARRCKQRTRRDIFGRFHEVLQEARAAGIPRKDIDAFVRASLNTGDGPYSPPPKGLIK